MPASKTNLASLGHARHFWQLCFGVLVVAVAYLALDPQPPAALTSGWDKLNHALAFAALAWSACLALGDSVRWRWSAVAGLLAFGGAIELVQLFVPGRAGEWSDLLADTVGIVIGSVLAAFFYASTRSEALSASGT